MSDFSRLDVHGTEAKPEANFPFHKTHIHRPRKAGSNAVPALFWPVVTLLLSVSVALICWGAYNTLPQMAVGGEKDLRQGLLSSKFNPTSAEDPGVEIPELLPEPELDDFEMAAVTDVTGEPPLLPPALEPPAPKQQPVEPPPGLFKVELPLLAPVPVAPLPLAPMVPPFVEIQAAKLTPPEPPIIPLPVPDPNPLVYRESPSGDTPMLRNWKTLALYSLMTTTVFVQVPAPAPAGEKDKDKTLLERIDTLQETIKKSFEGVTADLQSQKGDLGKIRDDIKVLKDDGISQRLGLAAANDKIKQIDIALEKIRGDLDALRSREPLPGKPGIDKASVEEIKSKLGAIEQAILKLQPSSSRIALSPPISSSTGRVMLVNLYPEELLFVINQKSYRVAPGANMPLENVPAGALNYEVISGTWGLRARATTNLAANETFSLTAR